MGFLAADASFSVFFNELYRFARVVNGWAIEAVLFCCV